MADPSCCCDPPNPAIELRRALPPVCGDFNGQVLHIPAITLLGCPTSGGWGFSCDCTTQLPEFPADTLTLNSSGGGSFAAYKESSKYTPTDSKCYFYQVTCQHDGSGNTTGFTLTVMSRIMIGGCFSGAQLCVATKDYVISGTSPFGSYTRSGASDGWAPASITVT